jgi:YidC/Oxa1 family membrane protein insertase
MDTKRIILAIVLSFLVIFLYQLIFMKKAPEPQPGAIVSPQVEKVQTQRPQQKEPAVAPKQGQESKPEVEKPNLEQVTAQREDLVTVSTSLYQAVWSNKGGVLQSWKLRAHKNEKKEDLELVSAFAKETGIYPFALLDESSEAANADLSGIKLNAYNSPFYKTFVPALDLKDGQRGEVRFQYSDGKGIEVEKVLTFYGGRYDLEIAVNIRRNGQRVEPRLLWGPGIGNPTAMELKNRFVGGNGVTVLASGNLYRVDELKYKPEQSAFNFVNWAAYDENYFTALFLPGPESGTAAFLKKDTEKASFFFLSVSNPRRAFIGPKEYDTLTAFGHDARKIVRFGFFGFIAEILLASIKFIHRYIPNWGIAIIILTILIKIVFFPLTYSSTKSMAKMQELQPKVKALRAKYKKAKQDIGQRRQMNEEMMKLYKEHGVNPAGGCLPMLIQIPVFWGIFKLLSVAIELRHAPFMLWIQDLSVKDPAYVTPILMGITQFISQKMTPTSADPSQAKMMLIMPVIMTVFFMNFQSGLVLYWLTSNVLQIGQQYIMNRMIQKKKRESHGKRRKD